MPASNKKNMVLMIGGGVALALLVLAAFLLFRGVSALSKTGKRLDQALRNLKGLYDSDPFPSEANVQTERGSLQTIKHWYQELNRALRRGQMDAERKSPATFMSVLSETRNELSDSAGKVGTVLPPQFAFGFDRYFATRGILPAPDDVERLTQQLRITERICKALYEANASSVTGVKRDEFEAPMAGRSEERSGRRGSRFGGGSEEPVAETVSSSGGAASRPDAGVLKPGDLYSSFHFVLDFTAREQALMAFLNALAADELFTVVTVLRIEKTAPDVKSDILPENKADAPAAVAAAAPAPARGARGTSRRTPTGAPPATPAAGDAARPSEQVPAVVLKDMPRRDRMMSGYDQEKPMKVHIELDVYGFPADG